MKIKIVACVLSLYSQLFSLGGLSPKNSLAFLTHDTPAAHFLETGLYGLRLSNKELRIAFAVPRCAQCIPHGFFSTFSVHKYLGATPVWVGLQNCGGGFGLHRHIEHHNSTIINNENDLRHRTSVEQKIIALLADPRWVLGATFEGRAGGIDMSVGCAPYSFAANGGVVPTVHARWFSEVYGYTASLAYQSVAMRGFFGGRVETSFTAQNDQWGVAITPGDVLNGIVGLQGEIGAVRFGIATGLSARGADQAVLSAQYAYYVDKYHATGGSMVDPLALSGASWGKFLSSYVAYTWDALVVGLSNYVELPNASLRRAQVGFSVAIGILF